MLFAIVITVACIHSAANVLNDYFDARSGTDDLNKTRLYPFTGGSRFIQNGVMTEQQILKLGLTLLLVGVGSGLVVAWQTGPLIWLLGLVGVVLAWFYSAPPCLACHGLGDVVIAICFGILPALGTEYVISGTIRSDTFWLGFSMGCFVAAILWINSIPDIDADRKAGKLTLPARLGRRRALLIFPLWFLAGFLSLELLPAPDHSRLYLLACIPAAMASVFAWREKLAKAIPLTIVTQVLASVLLILEFMRLS